MPSWVAMVDQGVPAWRPLVIAAVRWPHPGPRHRVAGQEAEHGRPAPASRLTLRSWLRNMGDRAAMAEELHVHRQTLPYRLDRLSELFGSALQDPDQRARLLLVLAWDPPTEPAPGSPTVT